MTNYILADTSSFWWPVTVRRPDPETAGKLVEHSFKVKFQFRDQDQLFAEDELVMAQKGTRARAQKEREILVGRIEDWADVQDAAGNAVPFTREALDSELQKTWFRIGIYTAWGASMAGEEALLGN